MSPTLTQMVFLETLIWLCIMRLQILEYRFNKIIELNIDHLVNFTFLIHLSLSLILHNL